MPKAAKPSATKTQKTTTTMDAAGKKETTPKTKRALLAKAKKEIPPKAKATKKTKDAEEDEDESSSQIKGVGFKDAETAKNTIELIHKRSLHYQFQVIKTLRTRAQTHKHKTLGMEEAAEVFRQWQDVTYPAAKEALRGNGGFKPLVSKEVVSKLRSLMLSKGLNGKALRFVDFYTNLESRARISNQLVDEKTDRDWDTDRYEALDKIVPEGKDSTKGWNADELWDAEMKPTKKHLEMIAWAWSPTPSRTLVGRVNALVKDGDNDEE